MKRNQNAVKVSSVFFSKLSSQEISEELEVQFDQKEIELLQKLAGEDGLVV